MATGRPAKWVPADIQSIGRLRPEPKAPAVLLDFDFTEVEKRVAQRMLLECLLKSPNHTVPHEQNIHHSLPQ